MPGTARMVLQGSREGCDGEALIRSDILNKVALVKWPCGPEPGPAHSGRQRQRVSRLGQKTPRLNCSSDALQRLPLVFSFTHRVNSIWKLTFMLSQEAFTGLWNNSWLTLYVPTFYEHPIEILLPQLPECWHYRQTLPWSQGVSFHIL